MPSWGARSTTWPPTRASDAAVTLDFSRPVAVCLIMVLQFIPDGDDPWQVVRTLLDAMPSGSYLAVAHPANDVDQEVTPALRHLSTRMGGTRVTPRSHPEIERFFAGLEMIEPGLVQLYRWRPGPGVSDNNRDLAAYGGIGHRSPPHFHGARTWTPCLRR